MSVVLLPVAKTGVLKDFLKGVLKGVLKRSCHKQTDTGKFQASQSYHEEIKTRRYPLDKAI